MCMSFLWLVPLLAACSGGDDRPAPVDDQLAHSIALSELTPTELTIPDNSRPAGAPAPDVLPVDGPWRYLGAKGGGHRYRTALPFRSRALFFYRAKPGLALRDERGELPWGAARGDRPGWSHNQTQLVVSMPDKREPEGLSLVYPTATEREARLNWSGSEVQAAGGTQADFVWTTIQDGWDSRRGLLLPAPGTIAWTVEIPPAGELHFVSGLVEPELAEGAQQSDGAALVVQIEANGEATEVHREQVAVRSWTPHTLDLSRWAGQTVTLRASSEAGVGAVFDYVFMAEPVLASRTDDPTRVVMVFIDTLRPDRMSLYGYERDTTAALDAMASEAAVFTNARSVAPWTLPSARTIVTGRHPELYDVTTTVQEHLRQRGWATAFLAGNVYLSANFDMHRDWELHRVGLWPPATEITDDALAWLKNHEGRDAILQVHYMDPHLPYIEPRSYRSRYAGDAVAGLGEEFHLSDVRKARLGGKDKEAGRAYVGDRYDNNVRYATDEVARLLEALDDDDIVLVFADHGEELWDHGGFEHGHSLYDELLRVPLVIKAPGIPAGRIDAPVSLLDLTPTILDLIGVEPTEPLDGRSLVPLTRGEAGVAEAFASRDQAFGRPLYGVERWGVLHDGSKWSTHDGEQALFDLAADPDEVHDLLASDPTLGAPWPERLGAALGRNAAPGWRLVPSRGTPEELWALCTVDGGFANAWAGDDPLDRADAAAWVVPTAEALAAIASERGVPAPATDDPAAMAVWAAGRGGVQEVFLQPARPRDEVASSLHCEVQFSGQSRSLDGAGPSPRKGGRLAVATFPGRTLELRHGIGPAKRADTQSLEGRDASVDDLLVLLGYAEENDPTQDAPVPDEPPAAP
jgi:arylsulfatase A-like enzyme